MKRISDSFNSDGDNEGRVSDSDKVKAKEITKHDPQGLDLELLQIVETSLAAPGPRTDDHKRLENQIMDLVKNRGASIHRSRVLFILVSNSTYKEQHEQQDIVFPLLKTLVDLTEDDNNNNNNQTNTIINEANENGDRLLHVAAGLKKSSLIQFLISKGADKSLKNKKGQTALDCLEHSSYYDDDDDDDSNFRSAFRLSRMSRPLDVMPFVNSASLLMSPQMSSRLIDGWFSPRMIQLLDCTVTHELYDSSLHDQDSLFQKFKPTSLKECCCCLCGIPRIEYIPPEVLERNSEGFYKSFADGWEIAWKAIQSVLSRKSEIPTISRVEYEINCRMECDLRKWNHFIQKGGKVEYAIDGLLRITQNVVMKGDDGWEYHMFEDLIEALPSSKYTI